MRYKKYGKKIGMAAVCLILLISMVCLTNAKGNVSHGSEKQKENKSKEDDFFADKKVKVLAKKEIEGYKVEVLYVAKDKKEKTPEDGYFRGDFAIRTSKDKKEYDHMFLKKFVETKDNSFPTDGFTLWAEDYDGDGKKNDFSLGQGQVDFVQAGNFMVYRFYGVDEDGKIIEYHTSEEDGQSIITIPDEYSKLFIRNKKGSLDYISLSEFDKDGKNATAATDIVRYIAVDEIEKQKREPEYSLMRAIKKNMHPQVVSELKEHGIWKVNRGEGTEITYMLANASDFDDVTLRLDFTYKNNALYQYVCKEYGFTDALKSEQKDASETLKLTAFTRDFLNVESEYAEKKKDAKKIANAVDNVILKKGESMRNPEEKIYSDLFDSVYHYNERLGMITYYEGKLE